MSRGQNNFSFNQISYFSKGVLKWLRPGIGKGQNNRANVQNQFPSDYNETFEDPIEDNLEFEKIKVEFYSDNDEPNNNESNSFRLDYLVEMGWEYFYLFDYVNPQVLVLLIFSRLIWVKLKQRKDEKKKQNVALKKIQPSIKQCLERKRQQKKVIEQLVKEIKMEITKREMKVPIPYHLVPYNTPKDISLETIQSLHYELDRRRKENEGWWEKLKHSLWIN